MFQPIPYSKLRLSPANVRKHYSEAGIVSLANSILAHGLLQPMIATPSAGKKTTFDVHAGGRRWRAIGLLIERGDLPKNHTVDIRVCDNEAIAAEEISLAENIERENMTAADECRGFRASIDRGATEEEIAHRFSITVRQVQARLRLADLAPPIFEALEHGAITLDVAKAYGSTSDQTMQLATWNKFHGTHYAGNPNMIRRDIADEALASNGPVAQLVGVDEYLEAGGRVEQDLFAAEGAQWLDRHIAETIALDRMEQAAATFAETHNLAWVRPILDARVPYEASEGLRRYYPKREEPSEEAQARMTELADCIIALNGKIEAAESDDEIDALEDQVQAASDEYDAIDKGRPYLIPEEDHPHVGTFVVIGDGGEPALVDAFYTTAAAKPVASAKEKASDKDPGAIDDSLPRSLEEQLAKDRRDLLALHIAQDPAVALDLVIFKLCLPLTGVAGSRETGCSIQITDRFEPTGLTDAPASPALIEMDVLRAGLPIDWATDDRPFDSFLAFRELPEADKAAWLAFAVANSLRASLLTGQYSNGFQTALGAMLEINSADHWRPGAENFFDRIRKPQILSILGEFDAQLPGRYAASKKSELAFAAAKLCSGDAIVEPDVKARATTWIPAVMGFVAAEAPAVKDPEPIDDDASGDVEHPDDGEAETGDDIEPGVNDAQDADTAVEPLAEAA